MMNLVLGMIIFNIISGIMVYIISDDEKLILIFWWWLWILTIPFRIYQKIKYNKNFKKAIDKNK